MKKFSKKSRWMIYFSLFLSGTLIFSTVFYLFAAKDNINEDIEKTILLIVILIAVLAVSAIVISRLRLKKNTKNLSAEYFEVYEEISDKLNGSTMSNMEKKETMADILDLFLLADKNGRSVTEVVGENTDDFIKQLHQSFGYRSNVVFNLLTGIQYSVAYIVMLQVIQYFETTELGFFNQQISISAVFMLTMLSFIGLPFIIHFKRKDKYIWLIVIPVCILGVFIAAMELIDKFFLHIPWLYTLAEGYMNVFPSISISILWVLIFTAAIFLKWVQRKISLKRL